MPATLIAAGKRFGDVRLPGRHEETCTDSVDLGRASWTTRRDCGMGGFHGDDLNPVVAASATSASSIRPFQGFDSSFPRFQEASY
jgi:hypothetical protein